MPHDKTQQQAYGKQHYAKHKKRIKAKAVERKHTIRAWFKEYKEALSCTLCPENDPRCLEFHHKDPSTKDFTIGEAASCGYGVERLKQEIAKCVVLCANCHRKVTLPDY